MKNTKCNSLPKTINIIDEDGNLNTISYKEFIEHENYIIEDNINFGITHMYDFYINEKECQKYIKQYEQQARKELKDLKNKLRHNPNLLLTLDKQTQRYIISKEA